MSTETQPGSAGTAMRAAKETLTVTDNRTGQDLRAADHRRHHAGDGTAPDQGLRRGLRADGLRPGLHEHRLLPQRDHLHRRRQGHPPAPRLPDRAAVRALHIPGGRLPADPRRAARRRPSSTSGSTRSRSTRSCTRTSRTSCRGSATTPIRWACSWPRSARSRPSIPKPTGSTMSDVRAIQIIRLLAKMPTLAAFAFRHNMGQPYVYPDNDLATPAISWR